MPGFSLLSCSAPTRGEQRERAICSAALELLSEGSWESVTMDAVAARAKASKATIYRRWASKSDLVIRALQLELEDNPPPNPDTGSLAGDIRSLLHFQARQDRCAINTATLRGLAHATASEPEVAGQIFQMLEVAGRQVWTAILDRAHHRGELGTAVDPDIPWLVSKAMLFCRMGMEPGDPDGQYLDQVVDDILLPVIRHQAAVRGSVGAS